MTSYINRAMQYRPFRYLIGACGLVTLGLTLPPDSFPEWFNVLTNQIHGSDKVIHAFLFSAFFLFVSKYGHWSYGTVALGCVLFGGVTELMQGLTPSRTPSWMDFFYDTLGISLGYLILLRNKQRQANEKQT